jgi:hypothetical protein
VPWAFGAGSSSREIDAVRYPSRRKGGAMAKKKGTKKAAKGGKEK